MEFSIFYFSGDGSTIETDKYKLLLETAKLADKNGFLAVWTPERHFHPFGGLYPNPSVISAALAMVTQNIQLRSGSIVMPLQHPVRVAEEWAVVDNLSGGRVGISFAPGWHADDFLLRPENYAERKEIMWRDIETVRKFWRGEDLEFIGGSGNKVKVKTYPRPIQSQLPVWITCQSDSSFIGAGKIGANILTSMLYTTIEDLEARITLYRRTLIQHGHEPKSCKVSLMMHTYVDDNESLILEQVKQPFCNYLKTHFDLVENLAKRMNFQVNPENLTEEDRQQLLEFAFERYFQQDRVLIGTPENCQRIVERLQKIGVDEIACLVDFGLDFDTVMTSLNKLTDFKQNYQPTKDTSKYSSLSLFG